MRKMFSFGLFLYKPDKPYKPVIKKSTVKAVNAYRGKLAHEKRSKLFPYVRAIDFYDR